MITSFNTLGQEGGGGDKGGVTSYNDLTDKPKLNNITIRGSLSLQDINVYSINEVNDLLADKAQAEFVDQLPATPEENTWYYSKKFQDGTDVPNDKRALYIVLEDITAYNYMGIVGDIDLTGYYTKTEVDNKVFDLTVDNFRDGVITKRITDTVTNSTIPTGSAVRSALATKQDTLVASDQFAAPTDTDKLSFVSGVTNNRLTFAKIWEWIVSKLTSNTEKGIQVSGGKLGHSNSITVPTAKRILQATYDAQGHVTAIETEFNWSNNYTNSAENQLFTRKGANDMYVNYLKSTNGKLTKNSVITSDYSHWVKCGNIYQITIGFQNNADIAKDAILYTLPATIANASVEMYIVISTINGDTKILQCGGSYGGNQIKAKQVIPSGYWFGSAIFIKV